MMMFVPLPLPDPYTLELLETSLGVVFVFGVFIMFGLMPTGGGSRSPSVRLA